MARLGRYFVPGQPLHVIQRGNDRSAIFFADDDYARYREWLIAASAEHGVSVHAHVLMTNHVHLLLTPETAESLPRAMQSLGRRYVRFINTHDRRTGTLWEGRYRAAPIDRTVTSSRAAATSSSIRCARMAFTAKRRSGSYSVGLTSS
jgi:putative transposase